MAPGKDAIARSGSLLDDRGLSRHLVPEFRPGQRARPASDQCVHALQACRDGVPVPDSPDGKWEGGHWKGKLAAMLPRITTTRLLRAAKLKRIRQASMIRRCGLLLTLLCPNNAAVAVVPFAVAVLGIRWLSASSKRGLESELANRSGQQHHHSPAFRQFCQTKREL